MLKIKETDLRLLTYLYQHNRESLTKIAKETNLSREQVDYKIKKYESQGIIKGYLPLFNYSKFGYNCLVIMLIKFAKPSYIQKFKEEYRNDKHRINTVEILSKYDLGMVLLFENEKERSDYIIKMLETNKNIITDHLLILPYKMEMYPLKFLGVVTNTNYLSIDYKKDQIKLDNKEKEILKLLKDNARARIIDIAKKTNLSAELVLYKLRRLQKEGLIIGSRTVFDMEKLGYFYTILFITMNDLSSKNMEKVREFAKNSHNVDTFYLTTEKPNCFIQLFHKDESELRQTIHNFKQLFKNESFNIELVPLKNEGEDLNALPFL